MLYIAFLIFTNIIVNAINCDVSQIHISQGHTPSSMTISWITKDDCYSHVAYGNNKQVLDKYMYGKSTSYNFTYILNNPQTYYSGYIHHVLIDDLQPNTLYFYKCGDFVNGIKSQLTNFTTLPKVGDHKQISFGVIGDLGQTKDSFSTVNHLLNDRSIKLILHAGDLSYADCNQSLWDSYGEIIEPLARRVPWMVCAGNHEIEFNGTDYNGLYTAFEKRYQMPYFKVAEFGEVLISSEINPNTKLPYCTPSIFQSEYNYGNSFYSFESGSAHIIYLNPYSNTNYTSQQYIWLRNNFASVDRNSTPWVIVVMHCPWYSSNVKHYDDKQTILMRDSMEELFYEYNVNIVFSGHVHAYERSYPVFKNNTNDYGPVYITIGDGGNLEGHDYKYYDQPKWSAFRNGTQYGHGILTLLDKNKLLWKWYRNNDGELIFRDELLLCNSIFSNTKCF
jgi:predicted phosphodiesterase